jgi:hypothetical protein
MSKERRKKLCGAVHLYSNVGGITGATRQRGGFRCYPFGA